jgi:hypothetical protein
MVEVVVVVERAKVGEVKGRDENDEEEEGAENFRTEVRSGVVKGTELLR